MGLALQIHLPGAVDVSGLLYTDGSHIAANSLIHRGCFRTDLFIFL